MAFQQQRQFERHNDPPYNSTITIVISTLKMVLDRNILVLKYVLLIILFLNRIWFLCFAFFLASKAYHDQKSLTFAFYTPIHRTEKMATGIFTHSSWRAKSSIHGNLLLSITRSGHLIKQGR